MSTPASTGIIRVLLIFTKFSFFQILNTFSEFCFFWTPFKLLNYYDVVMLLFFIKI